MGKKILKIISTILTVILFLILAITIYAKINMISSGNNYFKIFGYSIFKVTTGSMEPTIKKNDLIIVKETKGFKVNDIVTYISGKDFITHRIVTVSGSVIVTKGDANNAADDKIKEEDIIGTVVSILPKMGIWQEIFSTPKIIIILFITLLLFDFAFSYKGKDKEDKDIELKVEKKEEIKEDKPSKGSDYTVRLDLNQIQKNISSKIKK